MTSREQEVLNIFDSLRSAQWTFGTTGGASPGSTAWITNDKGEAISALAMEALPPGKAVAFLNGDRWEAYSPHSNELQRENVYHNWRQRGGEETYIKFACLPVWAQPKISLPARADGIACS